MFKSVDLPSLEVTLIEPGSEPRPGLAYPSLWLKVTELSQAELFLRMLPSPSRALVLGANQFYGRNVPSLIRSKDPVGPGDPP